MLGYLTWRDLALAFVRVEAAKCGVQVICVSVAKSGSVYVRLRALWGSGRVRLSNHRCGRRGERDLFSVHQAACGKLRTLSSFLSSGDWRCS